MWIGFLFCFSLVFFFILCSPLSACPSVCLSVLYLPASLSVCLSFCLSVRLSVGQSFCLSLCHPFCLHACLSVRLSPSVRPSVCLPFCLSVPGCFSFSLKRFEVEPRTSVFTKIWSQLDHTYFTRKWRQLIDFLEVTQLKAMQKEVVWRFHFLYWPTVLSLKILGYPRLGYFPLSCHTSKKGFQSI